MLGPLDMLTDADPYFAGIGIWLVLFEVVALALLAAWASGSFSTPSLRRVVLTSSVTGLLMALPWFYAVTILLGGEQ
jgi:hypothetical protein